MSSMSKLHADSLICALINGLETLYLVYVCVFFPQNVMPLSAGLFKSERENAMPQCPPRLHVQYLSPVLWSRVPNRFLKVDVARVSERLGWQVHCHEPLQFMSLHIPEENRYEATSKWETTQELS